LTLQQQYLASIEKGKKSIAAFYDEVEAESFHYLISEYVSRGDLFSVLTSQPNHKISESIGRQWFYSLCCSIRYLHAHSIAHLDLSLENICLDDNGNIKVIDFGLACQHPKYRGNRVSKTADGMPVRNVSNHIRLLSDNPQEQSSSSSSTTSPTSVTCNCPSCSKTSDELLRTDPSILEATQHGVSLSKLKYLCRPVCSKVHKPGKSGYMLPELYSGQCWDCYSQDIFALGVILYSMLTGRPPFTRPDINNDIWFKVIYTGQWLLPQVKSQAPASIYTCLSKEALDLINQLIKPQYQLPTIDQLIKHKWFDQARHGHHTTTSSTTNANVTSNNPQHITQPTMQPQPQAPVPSTNVNPSNKDRKELKRRSSE